LTQPLVGLILVLTVRATETKDMGFLETLVIVFVILKLTDVIAWSWLAVFSPMIIGYTVIFLAAFLIGAARVIQERRG